MTNSTQAVRDAIDAIVVALREGDCGELGRSLIQHCVVTAVDGSAVFYARNKHGVVMNAYAVTGGVMLEPADTSEEFLVQLEDKWLPMETRKERIRAKRIIQNEAIFIAVKLAKGLIADGHSGATHTQLSHIARFGTKGEREVVVAIYEDTSFSLNEITLLDDGTPCLSTSSVGGVLHTQSKSVHEAVTGYSDFSKQVMWDLTRVDGKEFDVVDDNFAELQAGVEVVKSTTVDLPQVEANPYPTPDRSGWNPIKLSRHLRNHKIIEAVKAAGGNIRDTHRFEKMIQLSHVALFGVPGYKEQVVALLDGKLFCLNPIELDHDEPFLSTSSVGGNLMHKELSMEVRLPTYQDYDHNILWELTRVDGK